jgi:glucokinase
LAILVDPVRIAVGGGIVRSWDRIGPGLEAALQAGVPFPPELVLAHFPNDAPLLGAVALAVDAVTGTSRRQPVLASDIPYPGREPGSVTGADHSHATTSTSNLA